MSPQVSVQREQLGRQREEMQKQYDTLYQSWLLRAAYLVRSYARQIEEAHKNFYVNGEAFLKIIESFEKQYESEKADFETRRIMLGDRINMINRQIEELASQGF